MMHRGFTLIELLVSVSILVIISAVTVPNFSNFVTSQNLKQAQENIKNGVRDAQSKALSGVDNGNICTGSTPCTHWGIVFTNNLGTFSIGKTRTTASCTLDIVDSTSNVLPGGAVVDLVSGTNSCIFFELVTGRVSQLNMDTTSFSNEYTVCVEVGTTSAYVRTNSIGRVRSDTGAACP